MSLSSKEDLQSRRGSDGPSSPRKTTPRGRERSDGKTEAEGEEVTNADEVFDDCWTANRKALESTRLASYDAYVPECQPDGKYQPTQCFKVMSLKLKAAIMYFQIYDFQLIAVKRLLLVCERH